MTTPDFDKIAADIAMDNTIFGPRMMADRIRAALEDAWNAGIDASADAVDEHRFTGETDLRSVRDDVRSRKIVKP